MRPQIFQVGGVLYWVIQTRDPDTMVLKDADSTPSVAVRKNGASVGDSVTITKRSATTGIYDCSYNPASEIEGDSFTFEESAVVTGTITSSATYTLTWNASVIAVERGTDSANTTTPPTVGAIADAVWDEARSGHVTAGTFGEKVNAELDAVLAAIAALNNLSAAQVNAEILDVLSVDTFGELSAPPAATSSLKDKLTWLFMWVKNKATETSTQRKLYADNSTTVVSTETVSDDGTTFTKTKAS